MRLFYIWFEKQMYSMKIIIVIIRQQHSYYIPPAKCKVCKHCISNLDFFFCISSTHQPHICANFERTSGHGFQLHTVSLNVMHQSLLAAVSNKHWFNLTSWVSRRTLQEIRLKWKHLMVNHFRIGSAVFIASQVLWSRHMFCLFDSHVCLYSQYSQDCVILVQPRYSSIQKFSLVSRVFWMSVADKQNKKVLFEGRSSYVAGLIRSASKIWIALE